VRTLVDTSVWSLALRKKGPSDHPAVLTLTRLLEEGREVALTGIVLQEVLQAFRAETTFRRMVRYLDAFPLLKADGEHFVAAAGLHRRCAAGGITASTTDCLIAALAIAHECILLSTDADFEHIARVSPLQCLAW
jgi:hypothetical protein